MAIGSINGGKSFGYSIGGKPLGVQIGQKSAADLLGGGNANNLFAANLQASSSITVSANDAVLKGLQDEIDRTFGYRTNLSVAEKQQLADLQTKITDIEKLAATRALTNDEISQRADLYVESYKILGKDYVDVSGDAFVQQQLAALDDLLATKPVGADARRLENLQTIEQTLSDDINSAGDKGATETTTARLISVKKQIAALTAPRKMSQLTISERNAHDDIVNAINDHVGQEFQLTSDKKLKIERLQATIDAISSGGGADTGLASMLAGGLNILA